jgi:hypothetical protein
VPDWRALCGAAEAFLELRAELLGLERFTEAVGMAARAAESYVLAGEVGRAADVLAEVTPDELAASEEEARLHLAQAAVRTRPDLVPEFVPPEPSSERARLVRAWAATETGPDQALTGAIRELEALIASQDEAVRAQAAVARLSASARIAEISWSEAAEAVLTELDDEVAPVLKAQHLMGIGDSTGAEDILLDNQENPQAVDLLVELAEAAEDWNGAASLLEAVLENAPTAPRRLHYAEVLLKADRRDDALEVLAALRVDSAVPTALRAEAYALSAQQAWDASDFATAARLSSDWLALTRSPSARVGGSPVASEDHGIRPSFGGCRGAPANSENDSGRAGPRLSISPCAPACTGARAGHPALRSI